MSAPDSASPIRDFFRPEDHTDCEGAHLDMVFSNREVSIKMNIWDFFPDEPP